MDEKARARDRARRYTRGILVGLGAALTLGGVLAWASAEMVSERLQAAADADPLRRVGTIGLPALSEGSGLVKGRRYPAVIWTHNDSGDEARIFALGPDGTPVTPPGVKDYQGIRVLGATNVDWEDIAADSEGNLILADLGNNSGQRRDLALYVVPEPDPAKAGLAKGARRIPVAYADQERFPDRNFDAEAVFCAGGSIFVLTKRWGDGRTRLYRLETAQPLRPNRLVPVGEYDVEGLVTAADASPDGRRLVVLTYTAVWLFEAPPGTQDYFSGRAARLEILAGQCEGVSYDGDRILISNEQRELFEVPLSRFPSLR